MTQMGAEMAQTAFPLLSSNIYIDKYMVKLWKIHVTSLQNTCNNYRKWYSREQRTPNALPIPTFNIHIHCDNLCKFRILQKTKVFISRKRDRSRRRIIFRKRNILLKLKPAINTAYKRKICMYWKKKLSVSIVKAVCCISSGMGGTIKKMFPVLKMSL